MVGCLVGCFLPSRGPSLGARHLGSCSPRAQSSAAGGADSRALNQHRANLLSAQLLAGSQRQPAPRRDAVPGRGSTGAGRTLSRLPSVIQQQCSHGRTATRFWRPNRPGCRQLLLGSGPQHQGGRRTSFSRVGAPAWPNWGAKREQIPGLSQAQQGLDSNPAQPPLQLCPPWTGRSGLGKGRMVQ